MSIAEQILQHRYHWRGRVYKTIGGLLNAAQREWPGCSLGFLEDQMYLRLADRTTRLFFQRTFGPEGSTISDQPIR